MPSTKRRIVRRGVSTGLPTKTTHCGHVLDVGDLISDVTVRSEALKMLTILNKYTREHHR